MKSQEPTPTKLRLLARHNLLLLLAIFVLLIFAAFCCMYSGSYPSPKRLNSPPDWVNFLYVWQSMAGTAFALAAALVGAWAIMQQAQVSREAINLQIEADKNATKTRLENDEKQREFERELECRKTAAALAAELYNWFVYFGSFADIGALQMFQSWQKTAENEVVPNLPKELFPRFENRFFVYKSSIKNLGLFEINLVINIIACYDYLQGVVDDMIDIREGRYDFPIPPHEAATHDDHKKSRSAAKRSSFSLQLVVNRLELFDIKGRLTLASLETICGHKLPDVPDWSKFLKQDTSSNNS